MDSRTKRTRERIISAFFELQTQKPREKIVVRTLCERAGINKSTFYKYYGSIYDLSEQIENEIVAGVLSALPEPAQIFKQPSVCLSAMLHLQAAQAANLRRCSETQRRRLFDRIHSAIKEQLFAARPAYRDNFAVNFYISYAIYGGFYAFYKNQDADETELNAAIQRVTAYLCDGVPQFWPEPDQCFPNGKRTFN